MSDNILTMSFLPVVPSVSLLELENNISLEVGRVRDNFATETGESVEAITRRIRELSDAALVASDIEAAKKARAAAASAVSMLKKEMDRFVKPVKGLTSFIEGQFAFVKELDQARGVLLELIKKEEARIADEARIRMEKDLAMLNQSRQRLENIGYRAENTESEQGLSKLIEEIQGYLNDMSWCHKSLLTSGIDILRNQLLVAEAKLKEVQRRAEEERAKKEREQKERQDRERELAEEREKLRQQAEDLAKAQAAAVEAERKLAELQASGRPAPEPTPAPAPVVEEKQPEANTEAVQEQPAPAPEPVNKADLLKIALERFFGEIEPATLGRFIIDVKQGLIPCLRWME